MANEPEDLFTGAFSFPSPHQPDKRQFGMVGCTVAPDGSNGVVIVSLHLRESGVTYEADGTSLKITLPEAEMRALLPIVEKALQRLQSLRTGDKPEPPRGQ